MPAPSPLPDELHRATFRVSEAAWAGVSRHVLEGRRFRAPFSGTRIAASEPDSLVSRCRAVLLLHPDAAASHLTAALLRGLPVPADAATAPLELRVPRGRRAPRRRGVLGNSGLRDGEAVLLRSGVRAVRADVTWGDLADRLALENLVVLGDAMLVRGLATLEELTRIALGARHRRGVRLLRGVDPVDGATW